MGDRPTRSLRRLVATCRVRSPIPVSVLVEAGPFAHQNPETWIWDAVTNKHLIVSRVEISLSRKP